MPEIILAATQLLLIYKVYYCPQRPCLMGKIIPHITDKQHYNSKTRKTISFFALLEARISPEKFPH